MVRFSVRGGAIDGMYFYPKAVQDRAIEIGLTTRETMNRKRKIFMTEFYIVMLTTLVLIIGLWNNVSDFKAAYLNALLFLEVMNWYDGIVIDEVWVRYSKFWVIPGCEDIPYVQTIKQMLKKRLFLTLVWVIGAAIVAGIVTLVF
jgi:hypothetical protein